MKKIVAVMVIVSILILSVICVKAANVDIFRSSVESIDLMLGDDTGDVQVNDLVLTEDAAYVAANVFVDSKVLRTGIFHIRLTDLSDVREIFRLDSEGESFNGVQYLLFAGNDLFFVVRSEDWQLMSVNPDTKEVMTITSLSLLDQDSFGLISDRDAVYWQDGTSVFSFGLDSGDVLLAGVWDTDLVRLLAVAGGAAVNTISDEKSELSGIGALDHLQVLLPENQVVLAANDQFVLHQNLSLVDHTLSLYEVSTNQVKTLTLPEGVQAFRCGYFIGDYVYLQTASQDEPLYVWSSLSGEWFNVPEATPIAPLKLAPFNAVYGLIDQSAGTLEFALIK